MNESIAEFQLSKPLILDMPDRLSIPRRLAYRTLTLAFWIGWIYLWLPLITLLGWLSGISFFRKEIVIQQGWQAFVDQLPTYSLVVLMVGGTLVFWALTNWARFAKREARKAISHVSVKEQADRLQVSANDLARWQRHQRAVVHHDDHGRILQVKN